MRRIILAAIALLIAGSAAVAAVDVDGIFLIDPLRHGSATSGPRACADPSDITTCVGGPPVRGDAFLVGVAIRNTRRLPVTITAISIPGSLVVMPDQVRLGNDWPAVDIRNTSPFAPFTLQSKGARMVYLIGHTTPCATPEPGDAIIVSGMTISYRWLVTVHQQQVSTPPARLGAGAC